MAGASERNQSDRNGFFCKHCKSTFIATTDLVDFHKQISNNTKTTITLDLMQKGSEKDIAKRNNVSTCTVNRILNEISQDKLVKNNGTLPTIMFSFIYNYKSHFTGVVVLKTRTDQQKLYAKTWAGEIARLCDHYKQR